ATYSRFVDDKICIILLANLDCGDVSLAESLARFYLSSSKPLAEGDLKTTETLKRVLLDLRESRADPARFTDDAYAALKHELRETAAFYSSLGPLKSFDLIERTAADNGELRRYRAVFGNTSWVQTFALPEGRIAEISIQAD